VWVGGKSFLLPPIFFIQIKIIILKLFFNFTNKYKITYNKYKVHEKNKYYFRGYL
jgi:hypothetical protein